MDSEMKAKTALKDFGNKVDVNFNALDDKYDTVSEELKAINKNTASLAEHIGTLVEDYVKSKKVKNG